MKHLIDSLAARAADLERDGVDRAVVQEMADVGLLAVYGPPELGGLDAPGQRQVSEDLAGASPDAWFVWFQHGPVAKALALSANTDLAGRHLADLCSGRAQGGVAWSNLRTARPTVTAERVPGGWRLDGPQPWCTGWPMLDLVLVGGLSADSAEIVFGVLPVPERLRSTGELGLAAMGGTRTHAVRYDGVVLPDDAVSSVSPYDAWATEDRAANANVQPSTFGIALAALDLLEGVGAVPAQRLREQVLEVREQAYALLDGVHRLEQIDRRLALRAQALALGTTCTTALLASRGGRGMGLDDPAQLLLRAAAFQVVHSQAAHVRAATLELLSA
jgi:alkylation response protein AidB-like acyl-CoA dehydrogenase